MKILALFVCGAALTFGQAIPNIKNYISCPNTPDGRQPYTVDTRTTGGLRRVVIDAPNAVCNDGSKAEIYVRAAQPGATEPDGPSANRWVIHFLGGSACSTFEDCGTRWCGIGQWEGTLMTTAFSGDFRNPGALLDRNNINKIGDRNEVLMKYCSSDQWQGRKSDAVLTSETDPTKKYSLHFRGATITDAVFDALLAGVPGMPKLGDATDVLISGDSAGAQGAKTHLDRTAARMKQVNPNTRVRGQFEAGFDLDFNGLGAFPPGDPNDGPYARKTEDFNRVQVGLRNALLDESCAAAHPTALYLCTDDGYLLKNHITTPFFQITDIQDPLALDGLQEAGLEYTPAQIAGAMRDQLAALPNIRNTAVEKAAINFTPGVVARNCRVHVTYANPAGYLGPRQSSGPGTTAYSYHTLLWNWMTGASPSVILAPKPPTTPDPPAIDPNCNAPVPNSPPPPTIATMSSASYEFPAAVAPESIVVTFGTGLATATATAAAGPWPIILGGLQVTVTDARGTGRLAPLYYVSPTQVMYLIPTGTAVGTATVRLGTQQTTVDVAATAPGIYTASQNGQGVASATYLRIRPNGARTEGLLFNATTLAETAIPVAAGDQIYLILYGTGLRGGRATATVGGIEVPVAGPVDQGQYQGLDQINLGPLPLRIGTGQKQIVIRQADNLANITTVTFRAAQ